MSLNSDLKKLNQIARAVERKVNPPEFFVITYDSSQTKEEAIAEYEQKNNVKIKDPDSLLLIQLT